MSQTNYMGPFAYTRVRDVKAPTVGTDLSAGYDFYIPNDAQPIKLFPGSAANIPSGIKVRLKPGTALVFMNKSGRSVKDHLQVGACVVDADYTGEVHLHVFNWGTEEVILNPGEKLVQALVLPYYGGFPVEMKDEETLYMGLNTERGDGGFGSTGLK